MRNKPSPQILLGEDNLCLAKALIILLEKQGVFRKRFR